MKKPQFKLYDKYRAFGYLAKNMDYIQEQLFNNSKNIIERDSRTIYYDCTNFFFEIFNEYGIKKIGDNKQPQPKP